MPVPARGVAAYRQAEVQTGSPVELVVMLFDGAIRFVTMARDGLHRGDLQAKRLGVSRALAILSELQSTLDVEHGGTLATRLEGLYVHVTGRLLDASVRRDAAPLDEALTVLTPLRDAFREVAASPHSLESVKP